MSMKRKASGLLESKWISAHSINYVITESQFVAHSVTTVQTIYLSTWVKLTQTP